MRWGVLLHSFLNRSHLEHTADRAEVFVTGCSRDVSVAPFLGDGTR